MSLLDFVLSVLRAFGFEDFQAKLSTRPPEKSVGEDELWDEATEGLRAALDRSGLDYITDEGGGAFYGPKIDVDVKDAIGRAWQLSTIQLDFNLPERFDLEYVASDGERKRPVMIHRALMGSVERFFGVLIEHYAGAFPAWLAPTQVRVLPVAEVHADPRAMSPLACVRRASGSMSSARSNSSASESETARSRSCRTSSWSATTTSQTTRSASTNEATTHERDVTVDDFIARLGDDVENKV